MYDKLFANRSPVASQKQDGNNIIDWSHLYNFANDVAKRQNKKVSVILSGLDYPYVTPEMEPHINTISIQLIRNSLVHGIESINRRIELNKNSIGKISITLARSEDNGFVYIFKDDGAGIDIEKVIQKAMQAGIVNQEVANRITKKAASKLIMSPEISTSNSADMDAGRGAGMSAVSEAVESLGGELSISTKPGKGVAFKIFIKSNESKLAIEKATTVAL